MNTNRNWIRIAGVGNIGTTGGPGADARLWAVNVNTGVATSVLTIREGGATGTIVAVIDCATRGTFSFEGARMKGGLYAAMTVAGADVTITYE